MNKYAIVARDLAYNYGDLIAVDHIDFEVGRGEIFGFLGPNGAGKTTTVKTLTGQMKPKGGEAEVLGFSVVDNVREIQSKIGICFEETNLYEGMSARKNFNLFVAVIILVLNGAFGTQPLLLILALGLGGIMASEFGLISGLLLNDITSLLALWKAGGIFLFAPGFVYLFPAIPKWIGKIIPTYYYISPVVEITQEGGGWGAISTSIYVLIGIIFVLFLLLFGLVRKTEGKLA